MLNDYCLIDTETFQWAAIYISFWTSFCAHCARRKEIKRSRTKQKTKKICRIRMIRFWQIYYCTKGGFGTLRLFSSGFRCDYAIADRSYFSEVTSENCTAPFTDTSTKPATTVRKFMHRKTKSMSINVVSCQVIKTSTTNINTVSICVNRKTLIDNILTTEYRIYGTDLHNREYYCCRQSNLSASSSAKTLKLWNFYSMCGSC